jgi:hypothetical protein
MGFGNPWYAGALEAAELVQLPSGMSIRLVTAPYFLATKLAAFASRGSDDYVMSHDLEDVVVVIDGRPEIVEEVAGSEPTLRGFLAASLKELAEDPRFVDALPGFLPGDAASQARQPLLLERIRAMAGLD